MSLSQTYLLAHRARAKLAGEASRPDHDLRRLVLHANTLDGLMLELADAEREQESWFNQSVSGASTSTPSPSPSTPTKASGERHIQWADEPRMDTPDQDWEADDVDSSEDESDFGEDEDVKMADLHFLARMPSHRNHAHPALAAPSVGDLEYDQMDVEAEVEEDEYYDDDEGLADLALHRTPSHSAPSSPPELLDDDDDESEDDAMTPPSPPTEELPVFSTKHQKAAVASTPSLDARQGRDEDEEAPADKHALFSESYYLRPRSQAPGLITAISVY